MILVCLLGFFVVDFDRTAQISFRGASGFESLSGKLFSADSASLQAPILGRVFRSHLHKQRLLLCEKAICLEIRLCGESTLKEESNALPLRIVFEEVYLMGLRATKTIHLHSGLGSGGLQPFSFWRMRRQLVSLQAFVHVFDFLIQLFDIVSEGESEQLTEEIKQIPKRGNRSDLQYEWFAGEVLRNSVFRERAANFYWNAKVKLRRKGSAAEKLQKSNRKRKI